MVNYAFDSAAHTASGCGGSRFFSPFQIQLVQSIICTLLQLRGSEHFAAHPLGTLRYFFALVQTARMSTTGKVKKRLCPEDQSGRTPSISAMTRNWAVPVVIFCSDFFFRCVETLNAL